MEAPQDYKTAGIFMLVSSILTLLASMTWALAFIWVCVGIFWLIPMAYAIFELITAIGVMQGQPKPNAKNLSIGGLVCAVLCCNVVAIVMEILAISWFGKPEVSQWMAEQGI